MDGAWIAVVGTAAGAGVTSVVGIGKADVEALSARGQRNHDAAQAKAQRDADKADRDEQHERERIASLQTARGQQINHWRDGLHQAALLYQKWGAIYDNDHQRERPSLRARGHRTSWRTRGFRVSAPTSLRSSASRARCDATPI